MLKSNLASNFNIEESYDLASDHSPNILTLCDTVINKELPPFLISSKTDWEGFREYLENLIST